MSLRKALADLLDHYTELVNCGDCGNWNPETEAEVIAARAALAEPVALAQSFLDKADEDWTFVDPEDVKRLARAVLDNQPRVG